MADDGILLNLQLPTSTKQVAVSNSQNLPKGKWTQRLKAKRAALRTVKRQNKTTDNTIDEASKPKRNSRGSNSNGIYVERIRNLKRSSEGGGAGDVGDSYSPANAGSSRLFSSNGQSSTNKSQVISSLFTSSYPISEPTAAPAEVLAEHDPSNAPLVDDTSFKGVGINSTLAHFVQTKLHFEHPTAIQLTAIPPFIATNPRDLFIQAQTGSGKTLAYVLPIIHSLMSCPDKLSRDSGLFAIIIAPTRELANQIYSVLETLVGCCHYIVPGIVIGGERKKSEKARLRKGVNILVSTPGRLADHLDNTEALHLSAVRWVVLDEGDRMTELGFQETITKILSRLERSSRIRTHPIRGLPNRRVTVLCSATLREDVEKLGEQSLSNALHINAGNSTDGDVEPKTGESAEGEVSDNAFSAPDQLHQEFIVVPMKLRMVSLMASVINIIKENPNARIMIFLSCSDSVNFHFSMFTRESDEAAPDSDDEDIKPKGSEEKTSLPSQVLKTYLKLSSPIVHKLHGSLNQPVRKATLAAFAKVASSASVLLCTDVASRGLDLPAISHVIEFDPPFAKEDHLHRVGRTARAGNSGWSTIFVLPGKEEGYVTDVLTPLHKSALVKRECSAVLSSAFGGKLVWQDQATNAQLNVERWILQSETTLQQAKSAFTNHVRAYTTHLSSERDYFSFRELHLGHLAKSFGLRETPTTLGRQNMAAGDDSKKRRGHDQGPDYAKKRMIKAAQMHANVGADEFNLG
ncbi:P-loop containing nucleoside triphosphate hydrolase protein [Lipomyces arxii]|uniref:P-loop containing nucleoside triphosphate hydrolase protein n=1 Tax=Lipomyces arxii TaxID=56418 RepID=UPI0034CD9F37